MTFNDLSIINAPVAIALLIPEDWAILQQSMQYDDVKNNEGR